MLRPFVLVAALAFLLAAGTAEAARYPHTRLPMPNSRYGVMATYHYKGRTVQRYTYPGYINQLPPPAFLYYGYPQSGHSYGIGF